MREYCAECHIGFGSAEKKVLVGGIAVVHKQCEASYRAKHPQKEATSVPPPVVKRPMRKLRRRTA